MVELMGLLAAGLTVLFSRPTIALGLPVCAHLVNYTVSTAPTALPVSPVTVWLHGTALILPAPSTAQLYRIAAYVLYLPLTHQLSPALAALLASLSVSMLHACLSVVTVWY
jgi:hypothetical protein